ncbi:MAG TPA: cold-shock protein [Gemmatimonadaceae bacterium]|nr:cold-shock protein [Gemmatimonadaceae bacterium]
MRMTGIVKWFDNYKGFGFIKPEDGRRDCFVHHSVVQGVGYSLHEGDSVEFNVVQGESGPTAHKVHRLTA